MSDVVFIAALIVFFMICALYIHLCDRMIGPDDPSIGQSADTDNAAGLALAALAVVYLLLVLVFPERF